jgi:hypothetical protein
VAKKKGSRKGVARGARKATSRRKKTAARPRAARATSSGGGDSNKLDLRPMEKNVRSQIARLRGYPPSPPVEKALAALEEVQQRLLSACAGEKVSMVIEFS